MEGWRIPSYEVPNVFGDAHVRWPPRVRHPTLPARCDRRSQGVIAFGECGGDEDLRLADVRQGVIYCHAAESGAVKQREECDCGRGSVGWRGGSGSRGAGPIWEHLNEGSEKGAIDEGQKLLLVIPHKVYAGQVFECLTDSVSSEAGVRDSCNERGYGNPFVLCTLQTVQDSKNCVQWVDVSSRVGGGG